MNYRCNVELAYRIVIEAFAQRKMVAPLTPEQYRIFAVIPPDDPIVCLTNAAEAYVRSRRDRDHVDQSAFVEYLLAFVQQSPFDPPAHIDPVPTFTRVAEITIEQLSRPSVH